MHVEIVTEILECNTWGKGRRLA